MVTITAVMSNDAAREFYLFLGEKADRAALKIIKTNRQERQLDQKLEDHLTLGLTVAADLRAQLRAHLDACKPTSAPPVRAKAVA